MTSSKTTFENKLVDDDDDDDGDNVRGFSPRMLRVEQVQRASATKKNLVISRRLNVESTSHLDFLLVWKRFTYVSLIVCKPWIDFAHREQTIADC